MSRSQRTNESKPWDGLTAHHRSALKELYCGIIMQAFKDLSANIRLLKSDNNHHQSEAFNWFFPHPTKAYEGFLDVCDGAGLDPAFVKMLAKAMIDRKINLPKALSAMHGKHIA